MDHDHFHDHSHPHSHSLGGSVSDEIKALLKYMIDHNDHHAEELADLLDALPEAARKLKLYGDDPAYADFSVMMVKSHLSLSHDPALKGVPKGWRLPIRDLLIYGGARFICPCAGDITLMPGTASDPAYRRVDIDTETGKVMGLF